MAARATHPTGQFDAALRDRGLVVGRPVTEEDLREWK
jgi:hypothetical protein